MISEVLWHSPDNEFEIYSFETVVKSPRSHWVNPRWSCGHVCAGFGGSLGSGNFSEWPWRNQGISFWNFHGIPLLSLVILRFCKCQHCGCLNDIIPNLGLHAACWAHVMCHHELCPTQYSDPIQVSYTEEVPWLYEKWFMMTHWNRLLQCCTGIVMDIMNQTTEMNYEWR